MAIVLPKPNENLCGIYLIMNKLNGKVYIGSSVDIIRRWKEYESRSYNTQNNTYIHRALHKYGISNFHFFLLEKFENTLNLRERELFYIKLLDSTTIGYNLCGETIRGRLGVIHTQDTKHLISTKLTGIRRTQEQKDRYSIAQQGNTNASGSTRDLVWKEEQRFAQIGKRKPNCGAYQRKEVVQFNMQGELIKEWPSIAAAARGTNQTKANIQSCLKRKRGQRQAGGYKWKLK